MKDTPGSSHVTADMRAELEQKFGARYVRIEDGARGVGMNRKQRRAARRKRG